MFPTNWFWRADDGRVFASARQEIVSDTDPAFLEAKEAGQFTRWPADDSGAQTEAALQEVLYPYRIYVSLPALKIGLKAEIDAQAERERLRHITGGAGQAMEYQQAAAEANAILAALAANPEHEPDPGDYPLLAGSIGLDGETLVDVATTVAAMHRQWQIVGSAIRRARLSAKKAIDEAADMAAARAVQPAWPAA